MKYEKKEKKIRFTNTEGIDDDTWQFIKNKLNYLGYDYQDITEVKKYFNRHTWINEDVTETLLEIFGEITPKETDFSDENRKVIDEAKNIFGETNDLNIAGYLTTNGELLAFTYQGMIRDIDHREIIDAMEKADVEIRSIEDYSEKTSAMIQFVNYGNIRLNERCIELAKRPNEKQSAYLAKIIRRCQLSDYPYFAVDIQNKQGRVVKTFEYSIPTLYEVKNDIDDYFKTIML